MSREAGTVFEASSLQLALVAARGATLSGHPSQGLKKRGIPRGIGGIPTSPEKGDEAKTVELHPQNQVTITHQNPDELARILEIAKLMGANVGPAKAGAA